MKILILDSGVRLDHPSLAGERVEGYGLAFDNELRGFKKTVSFADESGHGTAVYNIIKKSLPGSEIKMIKIFGSDLIITEDAFCHALEYIYENENPDILNLSLGLNLCSDSGRLSNLCKCIREKGAVVVSAFDNSGAVSYPAAFDFVVGVDGAPHIRSEGEYESVNSGIVNMRAKGGLTRLAWLKPDYIIAGGNSFACAFATVIIAKKLESGILDKSIDIFHQLELNATRSLEFPPKKPCSSLNPRFSIKKAAVFPFNKEIHSIFRFSHLLSFEVVAVYDLKYSGKVGASTRRLLKSDKALDLIVKNVESIKWDGIDALILGHLDELQEISNQASIGNELVKEALAHNVNVYSFDLRSHFCENPYVFTPFVGVEHAPCDSMGKMHIISKPVLGVFGTSSRQGKFSFQLDLRDRLQKRGYTVGQLGTEPSSLLFGMDFAFPFGYNKTVSLDGMHTVIFLNEKMHEMSQKGCDIIIAGSQSGTVPYSKSNISLYPIDQIGFLYGISPDAVVLAVNPFDEPDYIKRTMLFIENSVGCKVIGLSLFPMRPRNDYAGLSGSSERVGLNELLAIKEEFREKHGVFTGILDNEDDMENMADEIIDFFGE
jgi:uncharacterized NAD-dependent epimerase/dehydratase family protein